MLYFMKPFFHIILIFFPLILFFIILFILFPFLMMRLFFLLIILLFLHLLMLIFLLILICIMLFLFLIRLLSFLPLRNLFLLLESLPELNIHLVIFKIFIVNWPHLLTLLYVLFQVLQAIVMLFPLFFLTINCFLLINNLFFRFLLPLTLLFITKHFSTLAGVMLCKLKSRPLRITILGPLCLYLLTKLL
jgi:hypothetical protein